MKNKQNALLAGVAALALLAGTGLTSAQDHQDHGNAATKAAPSQTPSASPAAPSAAPAQPQASQGAGPGQQAQKADKGDTSKPQGAADLRGAKTGPAIARGNDAKAPHSAAAPPSKQRASTAQNEHGRRSGMRSAEERNVAIPKGLRSDASKPMQGDQAQAKGSVGGDVKLSDRQRTTIRDTVLHGRSAPRVGHVDFNVRVGTIVPRNDIHVVPVPETLVRIEPRWHGYLYFVYEDEIVIVDPRDMTIVAVLEA